MGPLSTYNIHGVQNEKGEVEMVRSFCFAPLSVLFCLCGGCTNSTTASIPAVTPFDAASYSGVWYEIARMPHWFERGMSNVKAVYTLEKDGTIKVVNSGIRSGRHKSVNGKAWFTVRPDVGELRVSFQYPFSGIYKVIWIDNAYSVAVVTGGDYSYLWILARKPQISENELEKLLQWITALGYETDQLIFTGQK